MSKSRGLISLEKLKDRLRDWLSLQQRLAGVSHLSCSDLVSVMRLWEAYPSAMRCLTSSHGVVDEMADFTVLWSWARDVLAAEAHDRGVDADAILSASRHADLVLTDDRRWQDWPRFSGRPSKFDRIAAEECRRGAAAIDRLRALARRESKKPWLGFANELRKFKSDPATAASPAHSSPRQAALVEDGMVQKDLCARIRCSAGTIRDAARAAGIKPRRAHGCKYELNAVEAIARMRIQKLSALRKPGKPKQEELSRWRLLCADLGFPDLESKLQARPRASRKS